MAVLAIVFAMSSAFAVKGNAERDKRQATTYYWYDDATSTYQTSNTISNEESRTGCMRSATGCEKGYSADQFNTPGQPSSGLKANQTPKQVLHLQ